MSLSFYNEQAKYSNQSEPSTHRQCNLMEATVGLPDTTYCRTHVLDYNPDLARPEPRHKHKQEPTIMLPIH